MFRMQHFTLRHLAIASLSRLFSSNVYTARRGLCKGLKRQGGLGFIPVNRALSPEENLLGELDLRGMVAYDIGAFHGLITLFLSQRCAQVVCYEPMPEHRSIIARNLRLNGITNVTVRPYAVSDSAGVASLAVDWLMPGGATADELISAQIAKPKRIEVQTVTLDQEIVGGLPQPDFVKIDVEGLETAVLRGASETLKGKPALLIELHGATIEHKQKNADAVLQLLGLAGYAVTHVESGKVARVDDSMIEGHLYCVDRRKAGS